MKNLILLGAMVCVIGLFAGCRGGTTNEVAADSTVVCNHIDIDTVSPYREAEDVYVDGNKTEYVLIFQSKGCIDRMLRDVEDDSVKLEGFYVAMDDWGYYYNECYQKLEAMGAKYYETSADKTVYCRENIAYRPQDSCACGVLVIKPGCRFEFLELMDFLYQQEDSE